MLSCSNTGMWCSRCKIHRLYLPQHRSPIKMEVARRPVLDAPYLFFSPVEGSVWLKAWVWEDIFPLFRKLGTAGRDGGVHIFQCYGSGMFIPDPNVSILDPRSKRFRIRIKDLSIVKTKSVSMLSEKWSGCSSRIWIRIFSHPGSRIQRSKKHRIPNPDPQHWYIVVSSLVRNIFFNWKICTNCCMFNIALKSFT